MRAAWGTQRAFAARRGAFHTRGAALDYAQEAHAGRSRQADGAPFMLHLREVASLLYDAGAPDHLIAAGVLHDVIEKTGVAGSELRKRFG
ncbi:MAG: bifunctional (p)ppGpp synthetase/guanosine-3',5'-bis(diphosphate) 3'-pyrophosphohydrolase, partial [Actinobacteria bacterium]